MSFEVKQTWIESPLYHLLACYYWTAFLSIWSHSITRMEHTVTVEIRDNETYMVYCSHSMTIAILIIVFILESYVPMQYFLMFVDI